MTLARASPRDRRAVRDAARAERQMQPASRLDQTAPPDASRRERLVRSLMSSADAAAPRLMSILDLCRSRAP